MLNGRLSINPLNTLQTDNEKRKQEYDTTAGMRTLHHHPAPPLIQCQPTKGLQYPN